MGPNKRLAQSSQSYLTGGSSDEALHRMDEAYGRFVDGKPEIFNAMGRDKIESYWGRPIRFEDYEASNVNVAVRGRLWALCLLLVSYDGQKASARAICNDIWQWAKVKDPTRADEILKRAFLEPSEGDTLGSVLQLLVSPRQKEACPEARVAAGLLSIVVDYSVSLFFRGAAERSETAQEFRNIAGRPFARPSDVFRALESELPEHLRQKGARAGSAHRPAADDLRARLNELSKLEPSIDRILLGADADRQYERAKKEDDDDPHVDKLFNAVTRGGKQKPRWIVVSGPRFCGKKAKVDALLRRIADRDDKLVAHVGYGRAVTTIELPICGWSAKGVHYRKLVSNVVTFLRGYRSHMRKASSDPATVPLATATLDELFELVRTLHTDAPALYIFTDVDAFSPDFDRNVIRDVGIRRLIQALLRSNDQSMVLITTNEDLNKDKRYVVGMPDFEQIDVPAPSLSSFENFIRADIRSKVTQGLFYSGEHDTLRGDDLICIASLINLANLLSDKQIKVCADFLKKEPDDRHDERLDIYRELIDVLRQWGLLHAIALIAASDDGLLDASLKRLLAIWMGHVADPTPLEPATVVARLKVLAARADGHFLLNSRMVRYDPEEFSPSEKHSETDRMWELDPVVGAMFVDALAVVEPLLSRQAHRLIAAAARERAQTKKVRMRSPLGTRATEDASRDIQSYVSLLASIELGGKPPVVGDELPLRLLENEVFSLDDDLFRARRSLRFAVLCLLKEDIDHDHRLTMVFDEDALRLDLYLLLFQPLGRRHHTLFAPLPMPTELPEHLSAAYFTDDQLMSFMNTVALSAYHAQRFDVVEWIAKLGEEVARNRGLLDYPVSMSRVWCSLIDAYILKGGMAGKVGHDQTLKFVTDLRETHFPKIDGRQVRSGLEGTRRERENLAWFKADMRLLARQAELHGLIGNDIQASKHYAELKRRETELAERFTDHDPLVLSGRVARRYIKFLLQYPLAAAAGEGKGASSIEPEKIGTVGPTALQQVKELIGVNTSRLRRFSGADRVGVMIDLARLASAEGDLAVAFHWAEAANVRAQGGSVSHGGRLEALAVCGDLRLRMAETATGDDADELLRLADEAIAELDTVASVLDYKPFCGVAAHLQSRLLLQEFRLFKGNSSTVRRQLLRDAHQRSIKADRHMLDCRDHSFERERERTRQEIVEKLEATAEEVR